MYKKVIKQTWLARKPHEKKERIMYSFHINTDDISKFETTFKDQFDKKARFGEPKTVNVSEEIYNNIVNSPFGGIWE